MLSLLFIYLASYAFKVCELHRLPIYYIVTSNLIATYDAYIGIPCTDKQLFCTYLIVAGLFIIGYVIAYKKIIKLDYRLQMILMQVILMYHMKSSAKFFILSRT